MEGVSNNKLGIKVAHNDVVHAKEAESIRRTKMNEVYIV